MKKIILIAVAIFSLQSFANLPVSTPYNPEFSPSLEVIDLETYDFIKELVKSYGEENNSNEENIEIAWCFGCCGNVCPCWCN